MTSAQMLKRFSTKVTPVTPQVDSLTPVTVADFARSANMSAYTCVKQKTCPICGSKGGTEHYLGRHPQSFFYCQENSQHVYEFDDDTGTCDRIPM